MTARIISAASRSKLAKLLGLLGSDHAGERDAAGLAAQRLVSASGLLWEQIINPPPAERKQPEHGTWRKTVASCLTQSGSLRPWELGFLRDLPKFQRLSTKQRYILREIADRVLQREAS